LRSILMWGKIAKSFGGVIIDLSFVAHENGS